MDGRLAQLIALASHGNAYLGGREIPRLWGNSTCCYCVRVEFTAWRRRWRVFGKRSERCVAPTPGDWFRRLRAQRARRLRIWHTPGQGPFPDRVTAGFLDGGGTWSLEAELPDGDRRAWVPTWRLVNPNAADQRMWSVTYREITSQVPDRSSVRLSVEQASEALAESLDAALGFSRENYADDFAATFGEALAVLRAERSFSPRYHADMLFVEGTSPEAKRLLTAARHAWSFGGVGSWNDLRVRPAAIPQYERVSERLFQAGVSAFVVGTNAEWQAESQSDNTCPTPVVAPKLPVWQSGSRSASAEPETENMRPVEVRVPRHASKPCPSSYLR